VREKQERGGPGPEAGQIKPGPKWREKKKKQSQQEKKSPEPLHKESGQKKYKAVTKKGGAFEVESQNGRTWDRLHG